jgi:hypothetical protein
MNRSPNISISAPLLVRTPFKVLCTLVASLITWSIAFVCTLCSVSLHVLYRVIRTITQLSFKCVVYILLGTIFLCCAVILGILSIVTLGAISLP